MSCPSCGDELLGVLGYCARCGLYAGPAITSHGDEQSHWLSEQRPAPSEQSTGAPSATPDEGPAREAVFVLRGYEEAGVVGVAGSFNGWSPDATRMIREGGAWVCRLALLPGAYEYKFVVDGRWVADPENPDSAGDEAGNVNSVLVVGGR